MGDHQKVEKDKSTHLDAYVPDCCWRLTFCQIKKMHLFWMELYLAGVKVGECPEELSPEPLSLHTVQRRFPLETRDGLMTCHVIRKPGLAYFHLKLQTALIPTTGRLRLALLNKNTEVKVWECKTLQQAIVIIGARHQFQSASFCKTLQM